MDAVKGSKEFHTTKQQVELDMEVSIMHMFGNSDKTDKLGEPYKGILDKLNTNHGPLLLQFVFFHPVDLHGMGAFC